MCPLLSNCERFAELVEKYFGFLGKYGFRRTPEYEIASGTLCKVVYLGKHVAIEVYLDIRDDYVGVDVVKVINGVPRHRWEGGFNEDLDTYLRRLGCFRKRPPRQLPSPIETALATWAEQLLLDSEKILADLPDSLPEASVSSCPDM